MYDDSAKEHLPEEAQDARQIVVFGVGSGRFGIEVDRVREMTSLGHLDEIAGAPEWVAGVIRIREEILPVVDLRMRLGMPTFAAERADLTESLSRIEEWHADWMRKCEHDLARGRSISTTTDKDACGEMLGDHRVFDEIPRLRQLSERMRAAHDAFHTAVHEDLGNVDPTQDDVSERLQAIRTGPQRAFSAQIDELKRQLEEGTRPMVIVVTIDDGSSSIQVDRVHSVVTFSPEQVEAAPLGTLVTPDGCELVREVVKTPNDPRVVQILDIDRLLAAAPTSPQA